MLKHFFGDKHIYFWYRSSILFSCQGVPNEISAVCMCACVCTLVPSVDNKWTLGVKTQWQMHHVMSSSQWACLDVGVLHLWWCLQNQNISHLIGQMWKEHCGARWQTPCYWWLLCVWFCFGSDITRFNKICQPPTPTPSHLFIDFIKGEGLN